MGCVSSNLLNNDDNLTQQLGSSALSQHIVSLTSSTYGLLNLDPPSPSASTPPTPPARFPLGSIFPIPLCDSTPLSSKPETINSWELMSGLDTESFRFSSIINNKQNGNSNPNCPRVSKPPLKEQVPAATVGPSILDMFEKLCPPNGENKVVIYTTTLRGIRKTFEACNLVRSKIEGLGVCICEKDVSMDRGFREELMELMAGKGKEAMVPPRVFVRGRYVGGVEEVMKIVEEGWMGELLHGLPKKKAGDVCEGCGDGRFLPCFSCNGSCKVVKGEELVVVVEEGEKRLGRRGNVVVRCNDCNENGLVLCPICS